MRIFAHRGLNHKAPENTIAAFRLAHQAGIPWLETDVDILGDGTPVILHDSTLERTTDSTGSIYGLKAADLEGISAGAKFSPAGDFRDERIPLLSDLVRFMQSTGMRTNLEIKSNEHSGDMALRELDAVISGIAQLPSESLLISSFNPVLLYLLHRRRPELELACLFDNAWLGPDAISICQLVGARTIHPGNEGLREETVAWLKGAGLTVNVWTVNDPARAQELEKWGADGIFTDIADEMVTKLGQ